MPGSERRGQTPGRRASDRAAGTPAWLRVAVLGMALAAAAYVLLAAREVGRPAREAEALRDETVSQAAALLAAQTRLRLDAAQAGLNAGAATLNAGGAPLEAVEAARRAAPTMAFIVRDPAGRPLAVTGAEAQAFEVRTGTGPIRAASDGALIVVGPRLSARIVLSPPSPGAATLRLAGADDRTRRDQQPFNAAAEGGADGRLGVRRGLDPSGEVGFAAAAGLHRDDADAGGLGLGRRQGDDAGFAAFALFGMAFLSLGRRSGRGRGGQPGGAVTGADGHDQGGDRRGGPGAGVHS